MLSCLYIIDIAILMCVVLLTLIQGSKANYSKLEEVLRKSSPSELESGVTLTSEAIERDEMEAKLYLLRAKLSFKLVRLESLKLMSYNDIFCSLACYQTVSWQGRRAYQKLFRRL